MTMGSAFAVVLAMSTLILTLDPTFASFGPATVTVTAPFGAELGLMVRYSTFTA